MTLHWRRIGYQKKWLNIWKERLKTKTQKRSINTNRRRDDARAVQQECEKKRLNF